MVPQGRKDGHTGEKQTVCIGLPQEKNHCVLDKRFSRNNSNSVFCTCAHTNLVVLYQLSETAWFLIRTRNPAVAESAQRCDQNQIQEKSLYFYLLAYVTVDIAALQIVLTFLRYIHCGLSLKIFLLQGAKFFDSGSLKKVAQLRQQIARGRCLHSRVDRFLFNEVP